MNMYDVMMDEVFEELEQQIADETVSDEITMEENTMDEKVEVFMMERSIQQIGKFNGVEFALSVIKWSDVKYEVAIVKEDGHNWVIDYSVFDDVFTVSSSMQVYGLMEHTIKPAYSKWEKRMQAETIEDLDLSVRTYVVLKREGIEKISQIMEMTFYDFANIRNFGRKSIQELEEVLQVDIL